MAPKRTNSFFHAAFTPTYVARDCFDYLLWQKRGAEALCVFPVGGSLNATECRRRACAAEMVFELPVLFTLLRDDD